MRKYLVRVIDDTRIVRHVKYRQDIKRKYNYHYKCLTSRVLPFEKYLLIYIYTQNEINKDKISDKRNMNE